MSLKRIITHPILTIPNKEEIQFMWNGTLLKGLKNEMISSALIANDIHIFGHHHKDKSPQGIFCANGQCSQCMIIADGIAIKACMTPLKKNMNLHSLEGLPKTIYNNKPYKYEKIQKYKIDVLIIGGGPAGLSAALELGKSKIKTILVDDKSQLGGKLVLQTHKFFGSVDRSYAGTRGFEIAKILTNKLKKMSTIKTWTNTIVIGIFSDKIVGVVENNSVYKEIYPKKLLITTGAREKMLCFPGNTLPGIYGAGAFQTLVNRDLIKAFEKILIIGGGNVGLITGYHAIQAGIKVVGVVEALPYISGYKVHADKLHRLGIPFFIQHTVVSAQGKDHVNSIKIAELNDQWQIKTNTEKIFKVDTVLIATGLSKIDEFYKKAKKWGIDTYIAGDAQEIAEASSAMVTGKIEGIKISNSLNKHNKIIPKILAEEASIFKSKPKVPVKRTIQTIKKNIFPVFHCHQEIPCNPCTSVCPEQCIQTTNDKITNLPYLNTNFNCKGCMACVVICPGLAITLVNLNDKNENPTVTIPYEMGKNNIKKGNNIIVTDINGNPLGNYKIVRIISNKKQFHGTTLIQVQVEKNIAEKVAGIQIKKKQIDFTTIHENKSVPGKTIICRCERVSANEIRNAIKMGVVDLNHMKAINRLGMGACGSKTCRPMVWKIFQEEGIKLEKITDRIDRPLFIEVPLGVFAGVKKEY